MIKQFQNIPIDICTYAVKNHCVNQLGTYCFLKSFSDGHIYELKDFIQSYIDCTGKSERTFFNHKKWLVAEGWLVQRKKGFHVIGFKTLLKKFGYEDFTKKGAIFENNFRDFHGFIHAAIISDIGKRKKSIERRTGAKKKGSASGRIGYCFSLPHSYLAKVLGVSKSTAQNFRQYAIKYLWVGQEYQDTLIKPEDVKHYRLHFSDDVQNLIVLKGKVKEQQPSIMQSLIIFKRYR